MTQTAEPRTRAHRDVARPGGVEPIESFLSKSKKLVVDVVRLEHARTLVDSALDVAEQGTKESAKAWRLAIFTNEHLARGLFFPAVRTMSGLGFDVAGSVAEVLRGERDVLDTGKNLYHRSVAGLRYSRLVRRYGRELFGSAKRDDEVELGHDSYFRLTYFPPKAGVPLGPALFHVGGVLPYGDILFRMLPESCFYDRFTERGIPVYALELAGNRTTLDYRALSLETVIDAVDRWSELAFEREQRRKMILEGYCGLAAQALAFVAAKPEIADTRFAVFANFVGPVDGTKCGAIAELMADMPETAMAVGYALTAALGRYIGGDPLQATQDVALDGTLPKSPLGRFATGWGKPELATIGSVHELSPEQRRALAGAYWISRENCQNYPIPVALGRYSEALFTRGVGPKGELPVSYRGARLSIADAVSKTSLRFVGFYGSADNVVPEETAAIMKTVAGARYRHVVHPVGHVAYILSPRMWERENGKSFEPNPVDVLLEAHA